MLHKIPVRKTLSSSFSDEGRTLDLINIIEMYWACRKIMGIFYYKLQLLSPCQIQETVGKDNNSSTRKIKPLGNTK